MTIHQPRRSDNEVLYVKGNASNREQAIEFGDACASRWFGDTAALIRVFGSCENITPSLFSVEISYYLAEEATL